MRAPRLFLLRLGLLGLAMFLVLCMPSATVAQGQGEMEARVKSAYLFNLVKFTEWPDAKFAGDDSPVVIGCYCDAGFARALEEAVAGKVAGTRRLAVRRVSGRGDVRGCHILFVGAEQTRSAGPLLATATERNVLSVGESPSFLESGGMVNFYNDQDTVHIEINPQNVSRAGLTLSSRLLIAAKILR